MNKFVKTLVLAAVTVVGTATFTSVEAISSDEAVQSDADTGTFTKWEVERKHY